MTAASARSAPVFIPELVSRRPSVFLSLPDGGRTWWAHFEFTRINIRPTILRKKFEDLREAGAKAIPSVGAQAMRTLLGGGRPSARRDQLRPVSPDK